MKHATLLLAVSLITLAAGCGPSNKLTSEEKRQAIDTMAAETLQRLYNEKVSTKEEIAKAVGYGAFSNANINIIFASAGGGYGVVVDNATGVKTYMRMGMGGLGLGIGVKDFRQVLAFNNQEDLNKFVTSGWEFGGHADAAAKTPDKGGEGSVEGMMGDTKVYALTEAGLALQATVTGTKYWKDKELN
jgi:lipid-binding SYLF domain-containing protein